MTERFSGQSGNSGRARRMAAGVGVSVLLTLLAILAWRGDGASGAGPLVIVEDVSSLGSGSFSGSVCFQVTRDSDGAVMSDNCVDSPATFAAPDGLEIGIGYSISISLADPNCQLFDDSRASDGSVPFVIRVSCDPSFMTATAAAQPTWTPTPLPTDTPTPSPSPTPEPTDTPVPTASPTPTPLPTNTPVPTPTRAIDVTPTSEPETATPVDQPSLTPTSATDDESDASGQGAPMISPQVVGVELSQSDGTGGEQRVRGTVTVTYELTSSPGGSVSVLFSIGNLESGEATIVPGDISLVGVGAPVGIAGASLGSDCLPLVATAMPITLLSAVPVLSCADASEIAGQFQQVLTFEFAPTTAVSLDAYSGSFSLTMALAP